MTTSEDQISLGLALQSAVMSQGAAAHVLQWLAQLIGTDTEAGAALRNAGIKIGSEDITPASTRSTSTSKSSSSSHESP